MSSQLEDAFNEAVERRVRMLQAAELVESWSCCGQTFTGTADFISGARAAHVCPPEDVPDAETAYAMGKAAAASPDERLREALELIRAHARLDLTERDIAEAERYATIADDALAGEWPPEDVPDAETAYGLGKTAGLREVNDLRDQVQMYEEKAERDWRDFGEMQDARIAADDRVVALTRALEFYADANNYVGGEVGWWADAPGGEHRWCMDFGSIARSALVSPDRPPFFTEQQELALARCEGYDEARAASPDERLREAAAWLVELAAAAVCEPRRFAENETELQWKTADAITATRAALAAADREAPDECRAPHCWYEYGTPCGTCPVAPPVSDEQEKP